MEKNTIAMLVNHDPKEVKKSAVSEWRKFTSWTKNVAFPWISEKGKSALNAVKGINIRLPKLGKINWVGILVIVVLANMADNGMLDEIPNLKWFVETTVRLLEWIIGLLREFLKWLIELPKFTIFSIEGLENWFRNMFAI